MKPCGSDPLAHAPKAVAARYDRRRARVVVELSNGLQISFNPQIVQGLEDAQLARLGTIEISPSGHGLHFPAVDADLYLPALLAGFTGCPRWMELSKSVQAEFVARGVASLEDAKRRNDFVDADDVVEKLRQRIHSAKLQLRSKAPQQS